MKPAVIIAGCYIALLGLSDVINSGRELEKKNRNGACSSLIAAILRFALVAWVIYG